MCSKISSAVMLVALLSKTSYFQPPSAPQGTGVRNVQQPSDLQDNVRSGERSYGGFGETPWFSNMQVRQHLRLPDEQFNNLDLQYRTLYGQYRRDLTGLSQQQLTAEELAARRQELDRRFETQFMTSARDSFRDDAARNRYQQVYRQYRGFTGLNDPQVQEQLRFSDEQQRRLRDLQGDWSRNMTKLQGTYSTDPKRTAQDYSQLQKTYREQMNELLTEQQRLHWNTMMGDPFDFPADVYFSPSERGSDNDSDKSRRERSND